MDKGFGDTFTGIMKTLRHRKVLIKEEDRDRIINISYIASDLKRLENVISGIRDRISRAFFLGVICGFAVLIAGLVYSVSVDLSFLSGYIAFFAGLFYFKQGIYQFGPMRKIEKGIRIVGEATNLDNVAKEVRKIVG